MVKKVKTLRIIFWLSLFPYLFLMGYSLYHAIFGYDMYTLILPQYLRTIYGWDAFYQAFIWTVMAFCIIPVLPVCLLYQVIYIILCICKRKT